MSPEKKAVAQVLEMIEISYKPRDMRELAECLVRWMQPDVVEGLAADFDEANAERAGMESEASDE